MDYDQQEEALAVLRDVVMQKTESLLARIDALLALDS